MKEKLEINLIVGNKVYHRALDIPKQASKLLDVIMSQTEEIMRDIMSVRMEGKPFDELSDDDKERVEAEFSKQTYGEDS